MFALVNVPLIVGVLLLYKWRDQLFGVDTPVRIATVFALVALGGQGFGDLADLDQRVTDIAGVLARELDGIVRGGTHPCLAQRLHLIVGKQLDGLEGIDQPPVGLLDRLAAGARLEPEQLIRRSIAAHGKRSRRGSGTMESGASDGARTRDLRRDRPAL